MFRRHVDFFAVLVITLGLLAVAKTPAPDWIDRTGSLNLRNAVDVQFCPVSDQVLANIAYILNR